MGLARVFDHSDPVSVGNCIDLVHRGGMAVEMDGHDGPCPGGDGLFDEVEVHAVAVPIHIDQDRFSAGMNDGQCRGNERVGGRDDLVAWADVQGAECQMDGLGPVAHAHGVVHGTESCELGLEGLQLVSQDELARVDHPGQSLQEERSYRVVLGGKVDERDAG